MNMKRHSTKTSKMCANTGNYKQHLSRLLSGKFSRITVYYALALPILLYGSEIWTLEKRIKTTDINRDDIFQKKRWVHPFDHNRNEEILEEMTAEPVDEKLRRKQIKLATTCNNNGQQGAQIMLNYRPNGRSRRRRPPKILLDEAETGLLGHSRWQMMT